MTSVLGPKPCYSRFSPIIKDLVSSTRSPPISPSEASFRKDDLISHFFSMNSYMGKLNPLQSSEELTTKKEKRQLICCHSQNATVVHGACKSGPEDTTGDVRTASPR